MITIGTYDLRLCLHGISKTVCQRVRWGVLCPKPKDSPFTLDEWTNHSDIDHVDCI